MKDSKEAPIASFRVPLDVVDKLIHKGILKENYSKSDLSKVARDELFRSVGVDVQILIKANAVYEELSDIHEKVTEALRILQALQCGETPNSEAKFPETWR